MKPMTQEQVEAVKNKYEKRILAVLNGLRNSIVEAGHQCGEPFEMDGCDGYTWSMIVDEDEHGENGIDVSFTIVEDDEGIAFRVDVVEFGGRVLGGLCPYNYSQDVWVRSKDAIEKRFRLFEQADPDDIVECIEQ